MSASETELCNLALSHLAVAGVTFEIQDLDTEKSKEAQACRRFYAQARDEVLRAFPWPFATVIDNLALVATAPNVEWAYSYRYPSDCLMFRRILSGFRTDALDSRIPYRLGRDASGELVFTDMDSAQGEWTTQVTNVGAFAPDFVQALAFLLASYIGPRVAGGDQYKLADRAYQLYQRSLGVARANAFNEEQADPPPDSEMIRAR